MAYIYSDPSKEWDTWTLPNVEVFQLTAEESAELDEDLLHTYLKRFPLATMNSRERDKMLSAMIEEEGIEGGWFYAYGFPGCLHDSSPVGPFKTYTEAVNHAQSQED
jgi:hypothetical protein